MIAQPASDAERRVVSGGSLQAGIVGHSPWDICGPTLNWLFPNDPLAIADAGIDTIRTACPHADDWLRELEAGRHARLRSDR